MSTATERKAPATNAPPAPPEPPAPRRPERASFVLPLLAALVLGLAVGLSPELALLGLGVVVVGGALLLRVDWAAMVVVGAAVFEDYLADVSSVATKALAALLVASWLVRRARGVLHRGRWSAVNTAVVVFTAVLLAATSVHHNGSVGTDVVLRYVGFLVVLLVLVDVLRGPLGPERLAGVYVLSCVAAAVCGILTYAFAGETRVVGPVADPNDLAFHLLAAVPLVLVLRRTVRRRWRPAYDVGLALLLVAMVGTLSRGALVGLAVMVVFAAVTRLLSLRAVAGMAVLLVTGVGIALTVFPHAIDTSLEWKGNVAQQNVDERLDLWHAAIEMTQEHPVLGLGPGAFQLYHLDYGDPVTDSAEASLDVAHNTYLEASAELGIPGVLALTGIFLTAVVGAWRRWRRDRDPLAGGVVAGLVGCCVAALFVSEQYFLPLWLLCALAAAVAVRDRDPGVG